MRMRLCLLLAAAALAGGAPRLRADTVFSTGFERPTYVADQPLVGQDGWAVQVFNGIPLGESAAVISTSNPASGDQAVRVNIGDLTPTGAGDYNVGSYRQFVNYDVAAAGFPIVRIEADVRLDGPGTAQTADRVTGDFVSVNLGPVAGDGYLGELSISSDGHLYGYSANDSYLFGVAITLGQYHHLALDLDFVGRTTTYLLDGQVLGTAAFDPSGTSNLLNRGSMVAYSLNPDPLNRDPSAYTAYFDNFSISTVPEPSGLLLAVLGASGLGAGRRRPAFSEAPGRLAVGLRVSADLFPKPGKDARSH